ncbi:oxygenase MpaB family protein, partial [Nocardia salmonicida]|uniref:oxygenase MpaB family protein n=1 Tax=Nocardia salmonicida TaxID=53431 RepID=UPI0033D3ADB6
RRHVLRTGGALGALGALGGALGAAPANAAPAALPWTWSGAGSVIGTGTGEDPRWLWDEEADPLVASLIDRGDVPRVNELLRTWTTNAQPLPAGLPADLHDFIERARQLPSWADPAKLASAVDFNEKRGLYLGLLYGLGSGMMSTVIPREARAVYYSQGGADLKDRISKTAKLGYDVGSPDAFAPGGEMVVTAVKTRLVHAAVRHLLPQSPAWSQISDERIPISQRDILVTWHSLPTTVMAKLRAWNIRIPQAESEGFLHSWQVTAHLLGVRDEFIPATWDEANAQSAQVLDPLLGPTPEGIELAELLLSLAAEIDGGLSRPFLDAMTRYLLGDRIADWLRIPRQPAWDLYVRTGWPAFLAFREALLPLPLVPKGYWVFDEFLRQGALFFLSEGKRISIEIPTANRPS